MSVIQRKLKNAIKDLHYKSSKYLCKNYSEINLEGISTQKIISDTYKNGNKKKKPLNKKAKRILVTLSHYKFRMILDHQTKKYGIKLNIINPYQTTVECSKCGQINEVGTSEVYVCENKKCKLNCGRDINAAINIKYRI